MKESNPRRKLLLAALLAMEPPHVILKLARAAGDGVLSEDVQRYFYKSCINHVVVRMFPLRQEYVSVVLKQFILAAESEGQEVLDEIYKQQISYLNASKEMKTIEDSRQRCYKSYMYSIAPEMMTEIASFLGEPHASKIEELIVTIRVSSNMLEGSTGCYIWPAGLLLSEFLLSYPAIFSGRRCLEIGAGTGLSSICLAHLKASKVIATDGNSSTVANLKHNLIINKVLKSEESIRLDEQHRSMATPVECHQLCWDSVTEDEIAKFGADIIIGADLVYDPSCISHLVGVLTRFLSRPSTEKLLGEWTERPVAFLATALRNIDTLNMFVSSARLSGLLVEDVTQSMQPRVCLPHVTSIDRSKISLHKLTAQ